jgi:hypothetical protein
MNVFVTKTINLTLFLFLTMILYGQKEFTKLSSATDSTFGYSADDPLKLKKGNQSKSIDYSYKFLRGLRTTDGQTLLLLSRSSVDDPGYNESSIRITNRRTGLPISGKLGILDKYIFLTSEKKDTMTLYVDIYNRGELQLPIGLKYEQP